jgi:hypothetical protein
MLSSIFSHFMDVSSLASKVNRFFEDRRQAKKNKTLLVILSLAGIFVPGLQRVYMGNMYLSFVYFLLGILFFVPFEPIRYASWMLRIICLGEAGWIFFMANEEFTSRFNRDQSGLEWTNPTPKNALSSNNLDELRRQGVITEREYQKRQSHSKKLSEVQEAEIELKRALQQGFISKAEFERQREKLYQSQPDQTYQTQSQTRFPVPPPEDLE